MINEIEINPKVCSGKPPIRGARIRVTVILDHLSDGNSVSDTRFYSERDSTGRASARTVDCRALLDRSRQPALSRSRQYPRRRFACATAMICRPVETRRQMMAKGKRRSKNRRVPETYSGQRSGDSATNWTARPSSDRKATEATIAPLAIPLRRSLCLRGGLRVEANLGERVSLRQGASAARSRESPGLSPDQVRERAGIPPPARPPRRQDLARSRGSPAVPQQDLLFRRGEAAAPLVGCLMQIAPYAYPITYRDLRPQPNGRAGEGGEFSTIGCCGLLAALRTPSCGKLPDKETRETGRWAFLPIPFSLAKRL